MKYRYMFEHSDTSELELCNECPCCVRENDDGDLAYLCQLADKYIHIEENSSRPVPVNRPEWCTLEEV